jgi:ankyrin repeat protein
VAAEITKLGGDLSFIRSGQLPYDLLHNRPILRLLLDAGLNPNMHDRDGHSLLWLAVGKADCVTLLLDRGADVNLRNTEVDGETALMRAAWLGDVKCVRLLLARGADPLLKTRFGNTALDEAKGGYGSAKAEVVRVLTGAMKKRE